MTQSHDGIGHAHIHAAYHHVPSSLCASVYVYKVRIKKQLPSWTINLLQLQLKTLNKYHYTKKVDRVSVLESEPAQLSRQRGSYLLVAKPTTLVDGFELFVEWHYNYTDFKAPIDWTMFGVLVDVSGSMESAYSLDGSQQSVNTERIQAVRTTTVNIVNKEVRRHQRQESIFACAFGLSDTTKGQTCDLLTLLDHVSDTLRINGHKELIVHMFTA